MIRETALICLALVAAASAQPGGARGSDVGRFQWFKNYIEGEMAKSETFKEIFEPVMSRETFESSPCSFMMANYLRGSLEFLSARYQNTLAAQYFNQVARDKVRRCVEQFDFQAQRMPVMMFEWSLDELFKRVAHLPKKPEQAALAQAAASFAWGGPYKTEELCQVATAVNQLRAGETSYETKRMVEGQRELGGSALVMWGERLDKIVEGVAKEACKQEELEEFFEVTCKADALENEEGLKFIELASGFGSDMTLGDRTRKYIEYRRICLGLGSRAAAL